MCGVCGMCVVCGVRGVVCGVCGVRGMCGVYGSLQFICFFPVNSRIQVFSPDGRFLYKFLSDGVSDGQVKELRQLCMDHCGRVWVTDSGNHRVQIFEAHTGTFLHAFNNGGKMKTPRGIVVDDYGRVIVSTESSVEIY